MSVFYKMNLSYWEHKTWLSRPNFTVIGSGIVGLSCALNLRQRFPRAKIVVLEKGYLPQGASTKNAGFACFGSLSEILSDLESHTVEEVLHLVENRVKGLELLRQTLGDKTIGYNGYGGYELFLHKDDSLYEKCKDQMPTVNKLLFPLFNADVFSWKSNDFKFKGIKPDISFNRFEGQLDVGKMMEAFLTKSINTDIKIFNGVKITDYKQSHDKVEVTTKDFSFNTDHLLIATNGFAQKLTSQMVKPARAQVLITKPINNLHIKGTFHMDRGYYYFRNIDNRIMFGGGRHLDFSGEETSKFGLTNQIQDKLKELLGTVILPDTDFEIDQQWSGIMGVGDQKRPIIRSLGQRVHCGIRLGGMGVAIGTLVGNKLANLVQ